MMSKIISRTVAAIAICGTSVMAASQSVVYPTAGADGVLSGSKAGEVMDKVTATVLDGNGQVLEIKSGTIWKATYKAVFEFKLPITEGMSADSIAKAVLALKSNGGNGCYPDKGASVPETVIFAYLEPEANGMIELTDDKTGTSLGALLPKDTSLPMKGVKLDVTEAVKKAVAAKSSHIGFRIETVPEQDSPGFAWRWRTSEFGKKFGKGHAPKLTLDFK
jgi:hypothetical protein